MGIDRNSVILGIGLGFIVLALTLYGVNSLAGRAAAADAGLTEDEIIAEARSLGMVTEEEAASGASVSGDTIARLAGEMGMVFPGEAQGGASEPEAAPIAPQPADSGDAAAAELTPAPVVEPTLQPTPAPVAEPTPQPTPAPAAEPTPQPTPSPAAESTPSSMPAPVESAEPEPVAEPPVSPSAAPENRALEAVRIAEGLSEEEIAAELKASGILSDEAAFAGELRQAGGASAVEAGIYLMPKGADSGRLLDILLDRQ